jgi:hypothetical protein
MNFTKYEYKNGIMTFPDGVTYTVNEAMYLSKDADLQDSDMEAIHSIKKIFDGRILVGNEIINPHRPKLHTSKKAQIDELAQMRRMFSIKKPVKGNVQECLREHEIQTIGIQEALNL